MMRFLQPGFFRVVLAAAVVASHLSNYEIGRPAVFAFFALSGFWVMRMYDEKYAASGGPAVFFIARLLRIWLPFAVAYLGVLAIRAIALGESEPQALASLAILGIASTGNDVLGVSWSLDIELQFYLLVPLLWLIVTRLDAWQQPVAMLLILAAVPLTALGWWLGLQHGLWTVLAYLPGFVAGLLIWHSGWRPSRSLALVSVGLFMLAAAVMWLADPGTRAFLQKDTPNVFNEDWFGMAWMAMLLPFIAYNVHQKSDWLDQHLGNFSYALYITHWPVISIVRRVVEVGPAAGKAIALAAVVVVAVSFYVLVDRNAEKLRQAYLGWRLRPMARVAHG